MAQFAIIGGPNDKGLHRPLEEREQMKTMFFTLKRRVDGRPYGRSFRVHGLVEGLRVSAASTRAVVFCPIVQRFQDVGLVEIRIPELLMEGEYHFASSKGFLWTQGGDKIMPIQWLGIGEGEELVLAEAGISKIGDLLSMTDWQLAQAFVGDRIGYPMTNRVAEVASRMAISFREVVEKLGYQLSGTRHSVEELYDMF